MKIADVRSHTTPPAFLPSPRTAAGFAQSLRGQIRSLVADQLAREMASQPARAEVAPTAAATGRASALHQALLTRTTQLSDTGPYADLTRTIGGQYLSPDVADVFVRQIALESGNFDPDVISGRRVSSAGAEGIAQLMPSSYPHVNRRDPVASLHAAAATMRDNLARYGGDLRKALAAYNAGAGRVAAEIARLGADWELGLPAETQTYLRELLGASRG
jgi:soluble lytic murein transglycosylase-like protein